MRSSTELLVYYCSMGCLSEDWNYHKVTCRSAGGYLGTAWEEYTADGRTAQTVTTIEGNLIIKVANLHKNFLGNDLKC